MFQDFDQQTLIRLAHDDGWAVLASFEHRFAGIESQTGVLFLCTMATVTVLLQER